MGKVYLGQTELTLRLNAKVDLTGATQKKIQYENGGGTGEFTTGEIDVNTSKLKWQPASSNDLNVLGAWDFWLDIIFANGRQAYSEKASLTIHEPGT